MFYKQRFFDKPFLKKISNGPMKWVANEVAFFQKIKVAKWSNIISKIKLSSKNSIMAINLEE